MEEERFVQKFDAVPQFWQFLSGLRFDDLIVELVQNDLDAGASRTSIWLGKNRLFCSGNGAPVDEGGWSRLGYVVGAGDQVSRKQSGIGAKNHGLKACFRLGDQIIVRSDGRRMVQTVYKDGFDRPPSPGTLPNPVSDSSAPSAGCSVEVPYRQKELVVPRGEEFRLGPTDEAVVERLFRNAYLSLPNRIFGVVRHGVRSEYTLCLQHHALGAVKFHWRAKRPRALTGRGSQKLLVFNRECTINSEAADLPSTTTFEQACLFRVVYPKARREKISDFFAGDRRSFRAEVAWSVNRNGKLLTAKGVRRYPIGYDAKSDSALTGLPVHFSGPFISDAERHGASQAEKLNDHIDEACKRALVDTMASYLLHRHGGAALQLLVPTQPHSSDELLSELVEDAVRKRAIPLKRGSRRGKRGRRVALGPRRHTGGGSLRVVLPMFTWEEERISPVLAAVCPSYEDQIDPAVPAPILAYLVSRDCSGEHDEFITFDEEDVLGRLQPLLGTNFFPWRDNADWEDSLSKAAVAERYLDVVFEVTQRGRMESEEDLALNAYLPDHDSIPRPFAEMYRAVNVPRRLLRQSASIPLLHSALQDHRLLKRQAWKLRPFGLGEFLDGAELETASSCERLSFWQWLRHNGRSLSRPLLKRIAGLPVWPATDGSLGPLDRLCEPRNPRVEKILAGALCRPSSELVRSGLVGRRGSRRLVLRREPAIDEVKMFLATQLRVFERKVPLSLDRQKEFSHFEDSLVALASTRGLRIALSELADEFAVALCDDGSLRPPGDLVRADGYMRDLHLPERHRIARTNRYLDRVQGWAPRPHPSTRQVVEALVEDGVRFDAHVPRLQEYVRQAKHEGQDTVALTNVPCIPVQGKLLCPRDLALRGRVDVWGEWKLRMPVTELSAEVQRIYRSVGVGPGAPDPDYSRRFFEWLASDGGGDVARHIPQILRQIGHTSGTRRWCHNAPTIPFIPVESESGAVELVTPTQATQARSRVAIPDNDQLAAEVRALEGRRPVSLAITESTNVTQPITAYLRSIGVKTLSEFAGEPVRVSGAGETNAGTALDHQRVLDSLRSGVKGKQLRKRLTKLGLDSYESRLRTNWRERLSVIRRVKMADSVDATYKLGRRTVCVRVDGKLDKTTGTLWLRSGADPKASFFDALAEEVFESPQRYYGSVLDRAYRIQIEDQEILYESTSVESTARDQSTMDDEGDEESGGLSETAGRHSDIGSDLPNLPSPRGLPARLGTVRGATASRPTRSRTVTRAPSSEETEQIDELKKRHYAWHCQACIAETEPTVLAPSRSYAAKPQHRQPIMHAHHCDHVNAGGAHHAGNILVLCQYHHSSLGDAFGRADVVKALDEAASRHVVFKSDNGRSTTLEGKVATIRPPQRREEISLFFTAKHADYWLAKARAEGLQ